MNFEFRLVVYDLRIVYNNSGWRFVSFKSSLIRRNVGLGQAHILWHEMPRSIGNSLLSSPMPLDWKVSVCPFWDATNKGELPLPQVLTNYLVLAGFLVMMQKKGNVKSEYALPESLDVPYTQCA